MLDSTVCTVVGKWGGSQDRLRHLTGAAAAGAPEGVHAAGAPRAGEAAAAPRAGEALRAPHTLNLVTPANGSGLPELRCVAVRGEREADDGLGVRLRADFDCADVEDEGVLREHARRRKDGTQMER